MWARRDLLLRRLADAPHATQRTHNFYTVPRIYNTA